MTQQTYEVITSLDGQEVIKRNNEDGTFSFIPMSDDNSDYEAYLATLASESAPTA